MNSWSGSVRSCQKAAKVWAATQPQTIKRGREAKAPFHFRAFTRGLEPRFALSLNSRKNQVQNSQRQDYRTQHTETPRPRHHSTTPSDRDPDFEVRNCGLSPRLNSIRNDFFELSPLQPPLTIPQNVVHEALRKGHPLGHRRRRGPRVHDPHAQARMLCRTSGWIPGC